MDITEEFLDSLQKHITDRELLEIYLQMGYMLFGHPHAHWLLLNPNFQAYASVDRALAQSVTGERNAELQNP